ncbi:hypothetical protein XENOCAPTIV_026649 [Xenoophorus captivus]|uniref:Uncharacterized protein n=1 Tax=Xenoophorus captivus TaxID=1517983 RepID=A0ABV0R241_9TELE
MLSYFRKSVLKRSGYDIFKTFISLNFDDYGLHLIKKKKRIQFFIKLERQGWSSSVEMCPCVGGAFMVFGLGGRCSIFRSCLGVRNFMLGFIGGGGAHGAEI